jgi:hypothetical protein
VTVTGSGIEPYHLWTPHFTQWEDNVEIQVREAEAGLQQVHQQISQPHVRSSRQQVELKARELLLEQLTPEQRASLEQHNWFLVRGQSGRHYRIRDQGDVIANIEVFDSDLLGHERVLHRLCGHIGEVGLPVADHLLAQKLMLEADEDAFLRLANRH